jgi:hypothetical protein
MFDWPIKANLLLLEKAIVCSHGTYCSGGSGASKRLSAATGWDLQCSSSVLSGQYIAAALSMPS